METYYIYKITNDVNDIVYIGQHKVSKYQTHFEPENDGYMGGGNNIRKAEKEIGLEHFHKTILKRDIHSLEDANKAEEFFIQTYKGQLYNISPYSLQPSERHAKDPINAAKGGIKNKGKHRTPEQRAYIAARTKEAMSKMSPEEKEKLASQKGRTWYTNGTDNIFVKEGKKAPDGYREGRTFTGEVLEHVQNGMRKVNAMGLGSHKGQHWTIDENGKHVYSK